MTISTRNAGGGETGGSYSAIDTNSSQVERQTIKQEGTVLREAFDMLFSLGDFQSSAGSSRNTRAGGRTQCNRSIFQVTYKREKVHVHGFFQYNDHLAETIVSKFCVELIPSIWVM